MPKTVRKAFKSSVMDDPCHLRRYLKAVAVGGSEDAAAAVIAREERVSIEAVKKSIRAVDAYRKQNEKAEFDYALRNLVISAIPQARETLHSLLAATELVELTDQKTGKKFVREMEDKTTRLEAIRALSTLAIGLQPKSPMIEQNISQTNQTAHIAGGTETTEDRMRRLRRQATAHRALPAEVAGVPEAIDAGGSLADDDDDEDEEDGDE
jgi:hypothetical protein